MKKLLVLIAAAALCSSIFAHGNSSSNKHKGPISGNMDVKQAEAVKSNKQNNMAGDE